MIIFQIKAHETHLESSKKQADERGTEMLRGALLQARAHSRQGCSGAWLGGSTGDARTLNCGGQEAAPSLQDLANGRQGLSASKRRQPAAHSRTGRQSVAPRTAKGRAAEGANE